MKIPFGFLDLQSTLFTVIKPLESRWMPLCFKKPDAGTLPAEEEMHSLVKYGTPPKM